jgi:hypothetical protein
MTNKTLCDKHGITIHVVGDVYTHKQDGTPIPADELDMLFVATPAEAFDAKIVESIPLAETQDEAEALAVKYLNLK